MGNPNDNPTEGLQKRVSFESQPVIVIGDNNLSTITEYTRALARLFYSLSVFELDNKGRELKPRIMKQHRTDALYVGIPMPLVVIGQSTSDLETWLSGRTEEPSLLLLDKDMPQLGGGYFANLAKGLYPGVPSYMVSMNKTIEEAAESAGVRGFVKKEDIISTAEMALALREIMERDIIPKQYRIQPEMAPTGLVHYL
jgi:CheY-like chemotaxis protein